MKKNFHAECEVLQFLLVGCMVTELLLFDLEDSLPVCWSGQGSYELALKRTNCSWTCYVVCEAFLMKLLANTQFKH